MAFLSVSGTTITVARDTVERETVEIGDRHRAFDGTLRSTIRSYLKEWTGETTPLDRTTADNVASALNASTQPQDCTGDLFNGSTISCETAVETYEPLISSTGNRYVVRFILRESS